MHQFQGMPIKGGTISSETRPDVEALATNSDGIGVGLADKEVVRSRIPCPIKPRFSPSIWPPSDRPSMASRRPSCLPIREAAALFAATILKGRLVHVFGTGHSRMAVEEMFPRYGSFPGFHPIVELSMTYHNPVVGANGQRQAMFLENVQGFGPVLWRNFATSPDDTLMAISTSGCNAVTIDVALEAKRLGMPVVALTSLAHADASTSRHDSGKKLHEVADVVLDQQAPAGDSAVWIDGPGDARGAPVERHRLHDHQPRQGRGRPPTHRGRLAPQGPHRRLPPRRRSSTGVVRGDLRRIPPAGWRVISVGTCRVGRDSERPNPPGKPAHPVGLTALNAVRLRVCERIG